MTADANAGKLALFDSHCHVFREEFEGDFGPMLDRASAEGVLGMIVVGTTAETSEVALDLASRHPGLHGTAGLHPHEAAAFGDATCARLRALVERDDCVAVGESGLDWFKEWAPREAQLASFRWHLALARELDQPIIIHSRDAHDDTIELVREFPGVRGVMHCFVMGEEEMKPYLEAGLYISFSGIVTFPGSRANQAAARACPDDRLLVETDAPFLAPVPHRGKRNEPAFCADTLRFVARERGVEPAALAQTTAANTARLFGLQLGARA
ncbi:putative deoxyribonuclease YcfH [Planctomycetes bacterium Poly30]|uniref:Putative deoxyribonuclease YcfH n=1 Tax=Saltatorellus ferox TaxID=2528018 RepID=A0A518EW80_9BACT|nr:putative deoxyribonuclease YcfH [Planctomycetes bacterium Poly30]